MHPGCRLRASGICLIPCAHLLPKSPLRASVKMAFLVARIGAQKDHTGEHFLTHGLKNTGKRSINGATRGLKNPGIGTDYLMAMIYIKEFRNQAGVAAYKAATNKTDD